MQSDLYSLGVLLFYLVTGKFPVIAGSMEQLARAHAHRQRQPLRDLRPDLPEAVHRDRRARARQRPDAGVIRASAQFESALRESLDAPSAAFGRAASRRCRRRRFGLAFAAAAAVLVALIAALIVWTGRPGATPEPSIQTPAVLPLVDPVCVRSPMSAMP